MDQISNEFIVKISDFLQEIKFQVDLSSINHLGSLAVLAQKQYHEIHIESQIGHPRKAVQKTLN
jgi:hypothetical protein